MIECIIKDYIGILVRADLLVIDLIKMEVYQEWNQKFSYSKEVKKFSFFSKILNSILIPNNYQLIKCKIDESIKEEKN